MNLRPARPADIPELVVVEVEAGRLFLAVDMPDVAADVPDGVVLARAQRDGRVWVAETAHAGAPLVVGYVVASQVDDHAHIDQVSVRPSHGRRGIGRGLISHVEDWGRARSLRGTTLTTFRDVPWNGAYYRSLGYRELAPAEVGPELAELIRHEASLPGLDPAARCAMVKPNWAHGTKIPITA